MFYLHVYLHTYMRCPQRPEEWIDPLGPELADTVGCHMSAKSDAQVFQKSSQCLLALNHLS